MADTLLNWLLDDFHLMYLIVAVAMFPYLIFLIVKLLDKDEDEYED